MISSLDLRCPTPILDREDHPDSPVEIAFHQVSTAEVDLILTTVTEIVDTTVLEEAADHTDHADVVAPTGNARSQAACAAYDELNLQPRRETRGKAHALIDGLPAS